MERIVFAERQIFRSIDLEVFIGNLAYETSEEEVMALCSPFGEVTRIFIPFDRALDRPRGYAFVTFSDSAAGEAAIKGLNGTIVHGRGLRVNRGTKTHRLF